MCCVGHLAQGAGGSSGEVRRSVETGHARRLMAAGSVTISEWWTEKDSNLHARKELRLIQAAAYQFGASVHAVVDVAHDDGVERIEAKERLALLYAQTYAVGKESCQCRRNRRSLDCRPT